MGFNDRIDDEQENKMAFLQELIDMGHLDGAALGITKQVIDKGEDSLSDKQKFVFKRDVLDVFVTAKCRSGCAIPWSEMYEAYDNGGYCGWCSRMRD